MITLLSDFGLHDPYVGIMKSRIAQRAPHIPVIDLTHQIAPFAIDQAGYWLYCCAGQFPAGTVHVAVVDPGVGSARSIAVLERSGQIFIAPDNGLLGWLAAEPGAHAHALGAEILPRLRLSAASQTFHGRDLMAPLAAELASGRVTVAELGPVLELVPGRLKPALRRADGVIEGVIGVIDHYGNALSTIPAAQVTGLARPRVQFGEHFLPLKRTYTEVDPGQCLALVNSSGMLELAAREASAALILGASVGQTVCVHDR